MAWACRSHSPPWSQIGQSSGWLISRNSITPSRALRTIGVLVLTAGGSPFGPGRQSRTPHAHEATGFGEPLSSTKHMRQLPAIDSRSWKQNRGISAPAASQAWSSVYSGGTSISLPSTMSLVMRRDFLNIALQYRPHGCHGREPDRHHQDCPFRKTRCWALPPVADHHAACKEHTSDRAICEYPGTVRRVDVRGGQTEHAERHQSHTDPDARDRKSVVKGKRARRPT